MEKNFSVSNKIPGMRVKELRNERHITQDKLAEMLHVEPNTVSMIENGRRNLTREKAEQIAALFEGVRPEYLLGYTDFKTEFEENCHKLADYVCHHGIVALKRYLESLGYIIEKDNKPLFHMLRSPSGEILFRFSDDDFNSFSEDVFDFVKMKILKKQGVF